MYLIIVHSFSIQKVAFICYGWFLKTKSHVSTHFISSGYVPNEQVYTANNQVAIVELYFLIL
jgi:hypothetical protein